jgi:hypothetical protein
MKASSVTRFITAFFLFAVFTAPLFHSIKTEGASSAAQISAAVIGDVQSLSLDLQNGQIDRDHQVQGELIITNAAVIRINSSGSNSVNIVSANHIPNSYQHIRLSSQKDWKDSVQFTHYSAEGFSEISLDILISYAENSNGLNLDPLQLELVLAAE